MLMRPVIRVEVGSTAHGVLRLLFEHGPQSQADIAERVKITKAACNQHFRRLDDEGLIAPGQERMNRRGRPSQCWQLRDDINFFLGIVFHNAELSASLVNFSGSEVYHQVDRPEELDNREFLLARLEEMVRRACAWVRGRHGRILQTFIGAGGAIAPDGRLVLCSQFPGLNHLYLEHEYHAHFPHPVYYDSVHYCQIHAESQSLPPDSTAFLLDWGLGIGGMGVCNRQAMMFSHLPARRNRGLWNIGHRPVVKDGEPCYCGQRGCIEAYAGLPAMLRLHPELGHRTPEELVEAALRGDDATLRVVRENARLLGVSLSPVFDLLGVDTVVFNGPCSRMFDCFEKDFRRGLAAVHSDAMAASIELRSTVDYQEIIRLGSALMARHVFFHPDEARASRGVYRLDSLLPRPAAAPTGEHGPAAWPGGETAGTPKGEPEKALEVARTR